MGESVYKDGSRTLRPSMRIVRRPRRRRENRQHQKSHERVRHVEHPTHGTAQQAGRWWSRHNGAHRPTKDSTSSSLSGLASSSFGLPTSCATASMPLDRSTHHGSRRGRRPFTPMGRGGTPSLGRDYYGICARSLPRTVWRAGPASRNPPGPNRTSGASRATTRSCR